MLAKLESNVFDGVKKIERKKKRKKDKMCSRPLAKQCHDETSQQGAKHIK